MSRRMRRALVLAAVMIVVVGVGLAAATAATADPLSPGSLLCDVVFPGPACAAGGMISELPQGVKDAAGDVFGSFMPNNPVDEWVKSTARSAAQALAHVQTSLVQTAQPRFLDSWWLGRYAVTFGIGIVVMAFTLTFLAARLSSQGPDGHRMLRQAGLSAPVYVPVMALAPAAVDIAVQMIYSLAGWLGQQATADTGTAVEGFVRVLNETEDPNNFPLGILGLLVLCLIAFLGALLAMIENGIATFGSQLLMLLVPIVAAAAIYPPARQRLWRVVGIILGLLLTPVMLFLAYWLVWGAAAAWMSGRAPDPTMVMLFVAVGSLVAVSAPACLGMLTPAVASSLGGHQGASQRVRQHGTSARRGVTSGARSLTRLTADSGGGSGSGAGSPARSGSTAGGGGSGAGKAAASGSKTVASGGTAAAGAAAGAATAGVATAATAAQQAGQAVHSSAERAGSGHGGGQGTPTAQTNTQSPSNSNSSGGTGTGGGGGGESAAATGSGPPSPAGARGSAGRGGQESLPINPEPSNTSQSSSRDSRSPQEGQT